MKKRHSRRGLLRGFGAGSLGLIASGILAGCGEGQPAEGAAASLQGSVIVDGSSTVAPISQAVAEEFLKKYPKVRVSVGIAGTGGGFKKFCNKETDVSDASRPIKASEMALCGQNKLEYIELPVAFDGLSIVVNPANSFASCLTVAELKRLWEPQAEEKIVRWSQVRPDFPDKPVTLYGAGHDSGTYDYFTEAIVGEQGASRGDFTPSEDDNVLVQGVAGDVNALGFFGLAYYEANKDKLKLLKVDGGDGCIEPTFETVRTGRYQPLSRPLFVYVNRAAADARPEIDEFIKFYLASAKLLVESVGYLPLSDALYDLALRRYQKRQAGSIFEGRGSTVGVSLEKLLAED